MTTKEIAEATGKPERTVQRWAKTTGVKMASIGVKLASVQRSGKPADYDLEETCEIIEHGMGKNAASLFRENAKKAAPADRLDRLEGMIMELTKAVAGLIPAMAIVKTSQQLLPAPPIASRDELRRIVNKAANESGDYSGTWNRLYQEVYYRLHINAKTRAENSGIQALDIIEDQGLLAETIAIAREIFN